MSPTPSEIWIGRGNDQLGPHALDKIRQLHADGALRSDDLLWWDGLAEWTARDVALARLGIDTARATPPPMPSRPVVPDLPRTSPAPVANARSPERQRALVFMALGLLTFTVLAAAAFAFLRTPTLSLPSLTGRNDIAKALAAASMYRVAYAEYAMSNGQAPQSLEDLGLVSAPFGPMTGVRLEAGTLLLDTTRGVLALQPFQNANGQIDFRCGRAAPTAGMTALGTIDSAAATTVSDSDLPDDCR